MTCPQCGVRKVATPWARAGSGFTLLFEAYVLAPAKTMPIANAAERLGEHDTRLWRIVEHYVWRAVEKLDLSRVRRIAADETSARRGHDYISLFVDMARHRAPTASAPGCRRGDGLSGHASAGPGEACLPLPLAHHPSLTMPNASDMAVRGAG